MVSRSTTCKWTRGNHISIEGGKKVQTNSNELRMSERTFHEWSVSPKIKCKMERQRFGTITVLNEGYTNGPKSDN